MHHILALSVIILHHVDSYSCRTVAKQLKLPTDVDTNDTESFEVKDREQEITGILKQLLARSSTEITNGEQLQKRLAKLTIEPYQGKNTTKMKDPLHWFDKHKKTIAPLAIIVTNLQELTELQNRDVTNEKKHLIEDNEDKTILSASDPQHVSGNSKQTSVEISVRDLNTNKKNSKYNSAVDVEADTEGSLEKNDNLVLNSNDLEDFSDEDDTVGLLNNSSPFIDVAWQRKQVLVPDDVEDEHVSIEKKENQESLEKSDDKNSTEDFQHNVMKSTNRVEDEEEDPVTEDSSIESGRPGIDQRVEGTDKLINLLLEDIDGTHLKTSKENENDLIIKNDNTPQLNEDTKVTLKLTNDRDDDDDVIVVSSMDRLMEEAAERDLKYKKKHRHSSQDTYSLSFIFNR